MTRDEFSTLFLQAIEDVLTNAKPPLSLASTKITIELHGAYHSGDIVSYEQALDSLYLGEDIFWRIITISLKTINEDSVLLFVGTSGHQPTSFEKTWNDPPGYGPFHPTY